MHKSSTSQSGIFTIRSIVAVALCFIAASLGWFAIAATPSSGTLSQTTRVLTYTAGPFLQSNPVPVPLVQSGPTCGGAANPCDSYVLTVSLSPAYIAANPAAAAKVTLSSTDSGSGSSDYESLHLRGHDRQYHGKHPRGGSRRELSKSRSRLDFPAPGRQ